MLTSITVPRVQLTNILTTDLSAITRGRGFPSEDLEAYLKKGIGWVPANQALTAFDEVAENPWGSSGDLRVVPDETTEVKLEVTPESPPLHFYLGDITELDGQPWTCCPRSFLKEALEEFESMTGMNLIVAFEHEFVLSRPGQAAHPAFSLEAFRDIEPFPQYFMAALNATGQEPEMFLPEYAAHQYEVTCKPTSALAAADRAVVTRLLARDVARLTGYSCSFAPKVDPSETGNGVHIHFSLQDSSGMPATYNPDGPAGMSDVCTQFAAGIVDHMPALCAITAPGVISYLRLQPHQWSSAYTCLGQRNREATLRICPVPTLTGANVAQQFNLEFRAADALSNPYLALGTLIRAGMEGISRRMPCPELVDKDPLDYSPVELEEMNVVRLPDSLAAALKALDSDSTAKGWFAEELYACYAALKQKEISILAGKDVEDMIKQYAAVY